MKYRIGDIETLQKLLGSAHSEICQKPETSAPSESGAEVSSAPKPVLMPFLKISSSDLHKAVELVRNHPDLHMHYLNSISGTHLAEQKEDASFEGKGFSLLYVFSRGTDFSSLSLRVDLPETNPEIDTIDDLFGSANWFEREIYDLLGVNFKTSSDLRRIMLPPDWVGHPLRKDYKEESSYNGMSTTREDELANVRADKETV